VHYCVTNMPPLAPAPPPKPDNATLPYLLKLATDPRAALRNDMGLRQACNCISAKSRMRACGGSGLPYTAAETLLSE